VVHVQAGCGTSCDVRPSRMNRGCCSAGSMRSSSNWTSCGARPSHALEEEEEHEAWYTPPSSSLSRVCFVFSFPLTAAIHFTIPNVRASAISTSSVWQMLLPGGRERFYPLTLTLAVAWLALLAFCMTAALDQIGCALAIPSTVMGLTLGAIGTSFPNLYASILTAQAGQAGMSICQAFGSNTFNLCIGLGLVWFLEALIGVCPLGPLHADRHGACAGCYMPSGFAAACPHLEGYRPPPRSGSLMGTSIVVFICIILIVLTSATCSCTIPMRPALGFFGAYALYVVYQVGAVYELFPPICVGDTCL